MNTTLSLLMPTRNRARYLPTGVGHFLSSNRDDVELIVCDASDDHSEAVYHLAQWLGDPRLRLIDNTVKTTGTLSSMVQNWSMGLDQTSGRWVGIVGDDDVCDPNVTDFIDRLEAAAPQVAALTWHKCHFDLDVESPREAKVPMGTRIMVAAGRDSLLKQAAWSNPKRAPTALASPYHGAVRRDVLERIKLGRSGEWFAYRFPDYDLGWSVAALDVSFAISERPFSIAGVSRASNSYGVRNADIRCGFLSNWVKESRYLDGWGHTDDPFLFSLPMAVLGFRNAFCSAQGIAASIDLSNFVGSLRNSLRSQEDPSSFAQLRMATVKFLHQQFGQDFGVGAMEYKPRPTSHYAGLAGELLVMPYSLFSGDLGLFARFAFGVVRPVAQLFGEQPAREFDA